MLKKFIILLFLILMMIIPAQSNADDHDGDPGLPICTAPGSLICEEFRDAVGLSWSKSEYPSTAPISGTHQYRVEWRKTSIFGTGDAVCPAGSPASTCGSVLVPPNQLNALITGLSTSQKYTFKVQIQHSNCDTSSTKAVTTCVPTYCGDGVKGASAVEACDGTDFRDPNSGYTPSCVNGQNNRFEGGTMLCTNTCQLDNSQCTACNTLKSIKISNGVNNSNTVGTGADFKCLVEADHVGSAILCELISYASNTFTTTACTFDSWSGNAAEFNCLGPSQPSTGGTVQHWVKARYPVNNNSKSTGTAFISSCSQSVTQDAHINVVSSETIAPTVSIIESSEVQNAPLSAFKNVTVSVRCVDPAGCDQSTFRLKRFDVNPGSCPSTYSEYGLASPQATSSKTVWFCAAAKDNLGNIGFSNPREVRPGCRDQCSQGSNRCDPSAQFYNVSQFCTNIDNDSCFEWSSPDQCSGRYSCAFGVCTGSGNPPIGWGNVWYDKNGNGQKDSNDSPLEGIRVSYSNSYEGGSATSASDGVFVMRAEKHNGFTISPIVPSGWRLSSNVCDVYEKYTSCVDNGEGTECSGNSQCSPPYVNSRLSGDNCNVNFGFGTNYQNQDAYCNSAPIISYGLARDIPAGTTDASPEVTFTSPPPSPPAVAATTNTVLNLTAHAEDDFALKNIEVYVDGALVNRCNLPNPLSSQTKSSDCTASKTFSAGEHTYYAIAIDVVGNSTRSSTPDGKFKVTQAVHAACQSGTASRTEVQGGLISATGLDGKFGNNIGQNNDGACVIDPKAAFVSFKIPTYSDLFSTYYTQSKYKTEPIDATSTSATQDILSFGPTNSVIYVRGGDLSISGNPSDGASGPGVVFVDGNLNILSNYRYGVTGSPVENSVSGTVFVVQGNVNVAPVVTEINAVIIAQGTIYTAGAGCDTSTIETNQLVVNGSLISIHDPHKNPTADPSAIKFCRIFVNSNNAVPSEKINLEPKYLSVLRDIFSSSIQKWTEIP